MWANRGYKLTKIQQAFYGGLAGSVNPADLEFAITEEYNSTNEAK